MPTIIQNLNSIITTKNQLKSILNENGLDPGDVFSYYPDCFRGLIDGESSYIFTQASAIAENILNGE